MTCGGAYIEPTEIKKVSVWRVLVLAKVKALKEPKQQWGCTMAPVEV
jgi:hypothetical protein